MRYAGIYKCELCNGDNIGVSLFVQGCPFHCHNCFNQETWDFNGGKEWTKETEEQFLKLIDRPYISRVSVLGGEPLANKNIGYVFQLLQKIKHRYKDKKIWLYTGYKFEDIYEDGQTSFTLISPTYAEDRFYTMKCADILVDGQYMDELKDLSLPFRGSSNQRIIDVKKSLEEKKVILWQQPVQ